MPARGKDGIQPGGGAEALGGGIEIAEALFGVGGDGGVGTAPRQVEPAKRHGVAVQDVVGPGQLAHDVEIAGVALVGHFEILQRILHISGLDAALGHDFGVDGLGGGGAARAQHLRQAQHGADAVGEIVVFGGEHAFEQRHGSELFAARVEQESQLGSGEQIAGRVLGEQAKLGFGLGFAAHAQEQVAQFAAQFMIARVQRQSQAEILFGFRRRTGLKLRFGKVVAGAELLGLLLRRTLEQRQSLGGVLLAHQQDSRVQLGFIQAGLEIEGLSVFGDAFGILMQ